jgi:hypothetical protein
VKGPFRAKSRPRKAATFDAVWRFSGHHTHPYVSGSDMKERRLSKSFDSDVKYHMQSICNDMLRPPPSGSSIDRGAVAGVIGCRGGSGVPVLLIRQASLRLVEIGENFVAALAAHVDQIALCARDVLA